MRTYDFVLSVWSIFCDRSFFNMQKVRCSTRVVWKCRRKTEQSVTILHRDLAKQLQRRRFLKSTNQKQEWPVAAMFVNGSELHQHSLQRTFQGCFLPSVDSFGQVVSEEEILQKSTNQKQELLVVAMFVNGLGRNEQSLQKTPQMLFTKFRTFGIAVSEEKILQKSTNQKQELPVVAMFVNELGRNEQSLQRTFHTCFLSSFSPFGQVVSEERVYFRNQPIRNKNCLWRQCVLTDRNEMSTLRTLHRFVIPCFGSFGLAVSEEKIFQKSTNQKQELPVAALFVNESGRNEHYLQRTFHRCFLPSFGSFGKAVSEEQICQKWTNQKQALPVAAMFVNESGRNEHFFIENLPQKRPTKFRFI